MSSPPPGVVLIVNRVPVGLWHHAWPVRWAPARHDELTNQSTHRTGDRAAVLHRRGVVLESITLVWNVVGVIVLAVAAVRTSLVTLAGFGLDSPIEIGASTVLWELSGDGAARQRRAFRLIGAAFLATVPMHELDAVMCTDLGRQHPRTRAEQDGTTWLCTVNRKR